MSSDSSRIPSGHRRRPRWICADRKPTADFRGRLLAAASRLLHLRTLVGVDLSRDRRRRCNAGHAQDQANPQTASQECGVTANSADPFRTYSARLPRFCAETVGKRTDLIFSEIEQLGENTPLSNLFDKRWSVVLDEAVPSAREEGKTFHSFRHFGNMEMILALVLDPIRESMMGHEGATVNSRHYKKTLKPEKLQSYRCHT